jgi:hypothetical protein
MRIDGAWRLCDDGVVRPVIRAEVRTADGAWRQVPFLVDSGGDHTVLSTQDLEALGFSADGESKLMEGVGGQARAVIVDTQIRMMRETGDPVLFTGQFFAFTNDKSLDMSVLGRDITNLFGVLIDRPQDVVCLVSAKHRCVVVEQ